jgi:hypothetical protein
MENIIERLRDIAAKTAQQVTQEDKSFIRELAPKYGVELPKEKPNCKSCYVDASVAIYKAIKDSKSANQENGTQTERELRLKSGVDVMWRGIRINAASATPEKLKEWISGGFPTVFCEK